MSRVLKLLFVIDLAYSELFGEWCTPISTRVVVLAKIFSVGASCFRPPRDRRDSSAPGAAGRAVGFAGQIDQSASTAP